MLTIKGELIEYAYNCLEDKYVSEFEDYISCEKHKWACQRLLNDFEKDLAQNLAQQKVLKSLGSGEKRSVLLESLQVIS